MSHDFCLDCGVLLAPKVYQCPVCGYDNKFNSSFDIPIDDEFLDGFNDNFHPEDEPGY